MAAILEVSDLKTGFRQKSGHYLTAVDGVSFSVESGEIVGIVGESGCGKSVTSLSIMQLLSKDAKILDGSVVFNSKELIGMTDTALRKIRGNDISMVFQEPMSSLNPVLKIGAHIMETLRIHQKLGKRDAKAKAIELLRLVGIPRAEEIVDEYPHQLSGGMRQRIMIAISIACNPKLLIADEPTTALDVTIQAQILDLLRKIKQEINMSIILITHDLGVVAEMCDRVIVMYAGKIVEHGSVEDIFLTPKHPYTLGLLQSLPQLKGGQEKLYSIPGNVPSMGEMPSGCRFESRCTYSIGRCKLNEPPNFSINNDHQAACWLLEMEVV